MKTFPIKLKSRVTGYEVFTLRDMNWDGFKNGELLSAMTENGFSSLITTDKNIEYQHNIPNKRIALIVLDVLLLKWEYVEPLIEKIHQTLAITEPGKTYIIK